MTRNIIIVIAIVQSYVCLTKNNEKQLYSLVSTIHNTHWMRIVFAVYYMCNNQMDSLYLFKI